MDFTGQVVIVTGAGRGIGRSVAVLYAAQGARVILAEVNPADGQETENIIRQAGGEAIFIPTDVSKPEDIISLIDQTFQSYGRIDILINNAGMSCWKSPYELSVEEWDNLINTNLRSVFLCSREAAKIMRQQGGGSIVNLSSTRALMSEPDTEAYTASKGGILSLTHALALSLAPDNIQVNAISPGWIETGAYDQLREIDHLQHPSRRVGKPEDVAKACLFLTTPGNNFLNGANIVLDGGMTRKMFYEP